MPRKSFRVGGKIFRSKEHFVNWLAMYSRLWVARWLKKLRCNEIGNGSWRTAYRVHGHPFVVKVTNAESACYTQSEFRKYSKTNRRIRRFLARPIAISACGKVAMYEYVPYYSNEADRQRLVRLLPKHFAWDIYSLNVRKTRNGHPKVVDYH